MNSAYPLLAFSSGPAEAQTKKASEGTRDSGLSGQIRHGPGSPGSLVEQGYVTDDKLFCVYIAEDPATVLEHAAAGGFPCDSVHTLRALIDPTSAEA